MLKHLRSVIVLPGIRRSSSKSHLGSTYCVDVPLIGLPVSSPTHQQYPVVLWHCAFFQVPSGVQFGMKIPAFGLSISCSNADCRSVRQSFGSVKVASFKWSFS